MVLARSYSSGVTNEMFSVPILLEAEIGQVDCSCNLAVGGFVGSVCRLVGCQCGAVGAGACAATPRNNAACRSEIADASDNCNVAASSCCIVAHTLDSSLGISCRTRFSDGVRASVEQNIIDTTACARYELNL